MPLEELLKLYNYGGTVANDRNEGDAVDSGRKERLRDVRPEKNRPEKNGLASTAIKVKPTEVSLYENFYPLQDSHCRLNSSFKCCEVNKQVNQYWSKVYGIILTKPL